MDNNKNLEAQRARAAFAFAEEGIEKQSKNSEFNYAAAVQELASIIRMNGLRAAMAYFYSKENAHRLIFEQVHEWLESTGILKSGCKATESDENKPKKFMKILLCLDDDHYRIVQAETLTLAGWMVRFAKAPDKKTDKNQQSADGNAHNQQP